MKPLILKVIYFFTGFFILFVAACISPKDTVLSRNVQNLTARYNVLYNARLLIDESRKNIESAYLDDYEQYLSVYKEPTEISSKAEQKLLDSAIQKTNTIVAEKTNSHYVDDAYFTKAKANYYKGNYFNASEFFDYVYHTYPDGKELRQASLAWKARSQLQLNNLKEASIALDSAIKNIKIEKKSVADIYATRAQFLIRSGREPEAITMLESAIKSQKNKQLIIRWTYLLAQLQQRNGQSKEAYSNYSRVIKSNAPFEMAFNAHLNRIHIEEQQSGLASNRIDRFKSLLRDSKNKDFTDQIYYHIAELYKERGEEAAALENYNTAIRSSTKNQHQQGLAYLQIAEIYFKGGDYKRAKAYYDSTLTVLSPSYSEYELIRLKSTNLDLLANRLYTISREDTLQTLARLSVAERNTMLDNIIKTQLQKAVALASSAGNPGSGISFAGDTKFYFNNPIAISQGLADFKIRWGNRKLEDNWRRSSKAVTDANPQAATVSQIIAPVNVVKTDTVKLRQSYIENLPLTREKLAESNQKIITAYYDIANFYKDVLKDNDEAVKVYEELLKRFPENNLRSAIYYNLYRIYANSNPSKSAEYRNMLVKEYPETTFAKVILDPDYNQKADEKAVALNEAYNTVYDLYTQKKYNELIARIRETEGRFGPNPLSAQLAYLNSLAIGRTQNVAAFEASLDEIVKIYRDDAMITPLVKQNIEYVKSHRDVMSKRAFALVDSDPNEPILEPKAEPVPQSRVVSAPANNPATSAPATNTQAPSIPPAARVNQNNQAQSGAQPVVVKKPSIFSLPAEAVYYYAINVSSASANVASSRFGLGQFIRSNYESNISHQLKDVNNENQLIFVGPFLKRQDAELFQRRINLQEIMKIPAGNYNAFVITKNDLEKLTSRSLINDYFEFYSENK